MISSGSIAFNFQVARLAAMMGHMIRRVDWTDRWVRFYNGLWWIIPTSGEPRVVTTEDFAASDFKALDWTHMRPDCIASQQADNPSRFPVCPTPYIPTKSLVSAVPTGPLGSPTRAPWTWLAFGGGGPARLEPPSVPDPILWPSLNLQAQAVEECLEDNGSGMAHLTVAGSVTLGSNSDPNAGGYYFVTVQVGGRTLAFLMPPGDTRFFDSRVGPVNIGSGVIGVTAFAVQAHGPGANIIAPRVNVSVPFECGSYCRWYGTPSTGCYDTITLRSTRGHDGTVKLTRGFVVDVTGGAAGSQGFAAPDWTGWRYQPGGDYEPVSYADPVPPLPPLP